MKLSSAVGIEEIFWQPEKMKNENKTRRKMFLPAGGRYELFLGILICILKTCIEILS